MFIEHVRGAGFLGRAHDIIQPVWGWCSAGCKINRRTEAAMVDAGFAFDEIRRLKLAPWMPAIVGTAHVATP